MRLRGQEKLRIKSLRGRSARFGQAVQTSFRLSSWMRQSFSHQLALWFQPRCAPYEKEDGLFAEGSI
jgi:hypothetical protein